MNALRALPLLALLASPVAGAVTFEVPVQGSRALTLAVPDPIAPGGDPLGISDDLARRLRVDLERSGWFELLDPATTIERGRGVEPGTFDFADWRVIGAAALTKLRILPASDPRCDAAGDRVCADVFVYDVAGQAKLAGARVRPAAGEARAAAHGLADAILQALVGEPGPFAGTLLAVRASADHKQIVVVGADGEGVQSVTGNEAINLSPGWDAAGRQVVWTSYKRGAPELFVKDLPTGEVRRLATGEGAWLSPAFSPDGRLVAAAWAKGGDTDLYLLDAQTGAIVRRLTEGGGIDVTPAFSPDGTHVAFASERSGGSQIYEVPVTGGAPTRITRMGGFFTDPVYSPDGTRLAFVSRKGTFDVLTVGRDGGGLVRITQDQGDNEDPTWSPDGRYLVFSSTRQGARDLWIATSNGRYQSKLTSGGGWSQPSWRP